jgi:hypothetical protein
VERGYHAAELVRRQVTVIATYDWGDALLRNPITGIAVCCARAVNGDAAAAPPSSVMNARRAMQAVIDPSGRRVVRPNDSTVGSGAPQGQEGLSVSAPAPYLAPMSQRTFPAGFIAPCLPTRTDKLLSGSQWLHEIKHDGFRVIARKRGAQVRLYSRPGNDLTHRFPLIVETLGRLRSRSCIIDGEAVACDDSGVASFDLVRHRRANDRVFLYAST